MFNWDTENAIEKDVSIDILPVKISLHDGMIVTQLLSPFPKLYYSEGFWARDFKEKAQFE